MKQTFYHGSYVKEIKELKPFSKAHNTIKKPVVYLTPNESLALLYIWNRPYKHVTFEESGNGNVVYTEWYEGQLYDFYNGVSGSIYECLDDTSIYATHLASVYNSDIPVAVNKETVIPDVYAEILEREKSGKIIINWYADLSAEEKAGIEQKMVRTIHMLGLLKPENYAKNANQIEFIKTHFLSSWEKSAQMSDEEINDMINAWRRSIK